MSEPFIENGALVVPGDTRCSHWPSTCAEVQGRTPTSFPFCDFCLYGPPTPPVRAEGDTLNFEEAMDQIENTERAAGERLKDAVMKMVREGDSQ